MHTSKKRLSKNFIFLAFLVCSALIFWASCAFGAVVSGTDYTWIKGSDGNWNESTSWNPEGVPNGSGDTATVDTATDVTVTMNGSYTLGGLTVGSGDRVLIDNAQTLIVGASASGGTIINNGTILLDATAGYTHLRANGVVTLDGSGSVELGHDTFAQLDRDGTDGGSFVNGVDHTIKGTGRIFAAIDNNGEILAQNGNLTISEAVENTEGTMKAGDSGATLRLSSTITGGMVDPEDGMVELNNTTLDNVTIGTGTVEVTNICTLLGTISNSSDITVNNGQTLIVGASGSGGTLTNNGTILLDATAGYTHLRANGVVTLDGSGSVELGHDTFAQLDRDGTDGGSFVNGVDHTIKGTGRILADIDNNGEILAQNGTLSIQSTVTGNGTAEIADNATLDVQQNLDAGDFTMANLGTLQVAAYKFIDLTGDFTFYQTDETKWNWNLPGSLQMSGAGSQNQTLEVGGYDFTAVDTGFSNNFNLPILVLTDSAVVTLVDQIDNGNRSSPEALYVGGLTVNSGSTLYLNGLNLYTHVVVGETSYVVQVYPGSGFSFGGGTIVSIPAGTYHVDIQSGSDTNDGSAASPWKTLHHAIAQISGGESGDYVLYVASGTYSVLNGEADEPLRLQQENVTIVGSGATPPVIDGTGAENWSTGLEMTGENLILQDLSVTDFSGEDEEGIRVTEGLNCQIHTCRVYGNNSGIRVSFSSNTLVSDCDIYQNSTHGIDLIWGADNDVIDNRIHDNPMYGVRVESGGESIPEISRNLIYDNDYGILVEAVNENTASPIIQNNVIYQVTTGAMSYGIFTSANNYGDANPEIYHNTIDGGTMSGIKMEVLGSGSSYPVIKYNTITNFEEYGIENSGAFPTVEYNDVWNNAVDNYSGVEVISTTNKSVDPLYVDPAHTDYSLQPGSECINAIPPAQEDPVGIDYPGYLRPRPGETDKDMGAYEYVADETVNYTLPTGTGLATDYRIFSIPLNLGTGADMLAAMVNVLGPYDNTTWRGFLYNGADYDEFNSGPFASHAIMPGMGYWIITTLTDTIPFTGKPAPDGVDYVMELAPGWHIIAPPWSYVTLYLDNFEVTDGIHTYPITSTLNDLTQQFLWDYTGNGAYSGYEMRGEGSLLQNDTGYFINVLSDKAVRLLISTGESNGYDVLFDTASSQVKTVQTDETPPPPPGSPPVADIKANGLDGPVSVAQGQPVTIKVTLDPEVWNGRNADWWVAAHTPFDPPGDWYTYVHPNGWRTGIHTCLQTPLFEVMSPFPVLNMVLPPGSYTFYFAVDGNMDGKPDATWLDAVQVTVE